MVYLCHYNFMKFGLERVKLEPNMESTDSVYITLRSISHSVLLYFTDYLNVGNLDVLVNIAIIVLKSRKKGKHKGES